MKRDRWGEGGLVCTRQEREDGSKTLSLAGRTPLIRSVCTICLHWIITIRCRASAWPGSTVPSASASDAPPHDPGPRTTACRTWRKPHLGSKFGCQCLWRPVENEQSILIQVSILVVFFYITCIYYISDSLKCKAIDLPRMTNMPDQNSPRSRTYTYHIKAPHKEGGQGKWARQSYLFTCFLKYISICISLCISPSRHTQIQIYQIQMFKTSKF